MYCHKALPFFFYALVKVFDCYTMSEIFMKFLITRTCGYEYYMLDRAAPQQRLWWAAAQDKKKNNQKFSIIQPKYFRFSPGQQQNEERVKVERKGWCWVKEQGRDRRWLRLRRGGQRRKWRAVDEGGEEKEVR